MCCSSYETTRRSGVYVPLELVEYKYFDTSPSKEPITDKQKELAKMARSYADERDLAFFVVNFGFSKQDYDKLTDLEKMFIRKEYESKLVNDMTHIRNAVLNAVNNAMRKKNKKFIELFSKKNEKVDREYNIKAVDVITEIERRDGKSWVDRIYQESGLRKPQMKEGD